MDPLSAISTRQTPQRQRADRRQVKNSAGGFTFTVDDRQRLRRFLVLGVDKGTYYASAPKLAKENADFLIELAERDHGLLLDVIRNVSATGAAHRQNATLFAYAIACSKGSANQRGKALAIFNEIVRTGTHLFIFAGYVEQFRGWGRALRRAVAGWYTERPLEQITYQMLKYRQREGWTHRDLLRLSHPKVEDADRFSDRVVRAGLFEWATKGEAEVTPGLVRAFEEVQKDPSKAALFAGTPGVSWEMLSTEAHNDPKVWEALLTAGNVPLGALVRQLPRLTRLGVTDTLREFIVARLRDREQIRRSKLHPMAILVAQRTYAAGRNEHGSSWRPNRRIIDALDEAFYLAFDNVEPTGKRTLLALDVSGSMGNLTSSGISARDASAAMAMVTLATEENADTVAFTSGSGHGGWGWNNVQGAKAVTPLDLSPRQRLNDAIRTVSNLPFGGTDCAAPMLYALENGLEYDAFVVYTDSETWQGDIHAHQALRMYRERTGINAKLVVVGMTATDFTIADPTDAGMMDVVGLDTATPAVISDFIRG